MKPERSHFLELPVEIRLIVYENLPREIHHYTVCLPPTDVSHNSTTLVIKSIPTSILRVCKQIYAEGKKTVMAAVTEFILASPPRVIDGPARQCITLATITRMVGCHYIALEGFHLEECPDPALRELCKAAGLQKATSFLQNQQLGRIVLKFVDQASHQLRYGSSTSQLDGLRAIECVKQVDDTHDVDQHWAFAGKIRALNRYWTQKDRIAVGIVGVQVEDGMYADLDSEDGVGGVENDKNEHDGGESRFSSLPKQAPWGCPLCGWRIPRLATVAKQIWREEWLPNSE